MSEDDFAPIWIGGVDRSGTTLIGSLLGGHDKILCIPESQFKIEIFKDWPQKVTEQFLEELLSYLLNNFRFKIWGLPEQKVKEKISNLKHTDLSKTDLFAKLCKIYQEYKHPHKSDASFIVDHSPDNFRHYLLLRETYPDSKFIHIVRDGRAVANSIMKMTGGPNTTYYSAKFWLERLSYGLLAENTDSKNVMRVYYEQIVSKPEKVLKSVSEFIEIDYNKSMLANTGFKKPEWNKGIHELVGKKVDPSRINKWEESFNSRQIEIFERMTYDVLPILGYEKRITPLRSLSRLEKFKIDIKELYYRFFNKIKWRIRWLQEIINQQKYRNNIF